MSESSLSITSTSKAPVLAGWICLGIAWVALLAPIPGTGFVGWPLNLVAIILAIISLSKGKTLPGVLQLVGGLILSPIFYFIGVVIMAALIASSGHR